MKAQTPLYYALMLARLASGQDADCDLGPALYPGTWTQYMTPNQGIKCQEASIRFNGQDTRKNVTIQQDNDICPSPLMNITIPIDAPVGWGSIRLLCENMEVEYCQMIYVQTRPADDGREASATEYAMTQDCQVIPTSKSEKYAGASDKPTTLSMPNAKINTPIGTAPTRAATDSAAYQTPNRKTTTSETPTKQPPNTKLPENSADKPHPTGSGRNGTSNPHNTPSTTNGAMPSGITSALAESHAAEAGATQTLPESGKTHAPPSSPTDRPCTCAQ